MTNAEKFRTPEERLKAHLKFCNEQKHCYSCELRLDNENCGGKVCVFKWLELEYKETELKPCPFCGEVPTLKTEMNACSKPRYYYVACSCGATFTNADSESDAVEMWNRRVK